MPQDLAIVLLSGGMDSCVTAALAARQHELALLHVSYGQRTAERERRRPVYRRPAMMLRQFRSSRERGGPSVDLGLKGKGAIVTGGSRGIGTRVALTLAKEGCDVAINFRKSDKEAKAVVEKIEAMGRKLSAALDPRG